MTVPLTEECKYPAIYSWKRLMYLLVMLNEKEPHLRKDERSGGSKTGKRMEKEESTAESFRALSQSPGGLLSVKPGAGGRSVRHSPVRFGILWLACFHGRTYTNGCPPASSELDGGTEAPRR
ncbi:uncharacterized protein LOC143661932 [Tamandua tetradactyla]|uniref:uncharacterized protein LOC143661932 n=1 Tax=Tamandua tetradactyla TaxID=48850 RepID=UPI004053F50F